MVDVDLDTKRDILADFAHGSSEHVRRKQQPVVLSITSIPLASWLLAVRSGPLTRLPTHQNNARCDSSIATSASVQEYEGARTGIGRLTLVSSADEGHQPTPH